MGEDHDVTWAERERWHYWKGNEVVEIGRSMIEYRPTITHQHFVVPYKRSNDGSATVVESDLREWDWLNARSRLVEPRERRRILSEIHGALSAGGIVLQTLEERPDRDTIATIDSLQDVADYLASLASFFRDIGADDAADKTFYASIQYSTNNPTTGDFCDLVARTLQDVATTCSDRLDGKDSALIRSAIKHCQ